MWKNRNSCISVVKVSKHWMQTHPRMTSKRTKEHRFSSLHIVFRSLHYVVSVWISRWSSFAVAKIVVLRILLPLKGYLDICCTSYVFWSELTFLLLFLWPLAGVPNLDIVESVDDEKVCDKPIFSYVSSGSFLSGFMVCSLLRRLLFSWQLYTHFGCFLVRA